MFITTAGGGAIAGSLIGGLMGGGSQGGTQTVSKEPWAAAAPWLQYNLQRGQDLQKQYEAQPFNPIQQNAFKGLLSNSDNFNAMMPGLLGQFSQQVGFDRSNPTARPPAYNFMPAVQAMQANPQMPAAGLLGASMQQATAAPAPAPAAPNPMDEQMKQLLARFSAPDFSVSAGG